MGPYLGDYTEDATIDFKWSSNDGSGASITRTTDGTISVYSGNSITQSVAGITDTEDFDSLTGIHHVRIDTSADAFYAVGNDYMVVLSAATIDGETVNAVLAHFSIENRFNEVDVASWLGTAVTLSATTTLPEVDVASISDDAGAANNAELDYDGAGYAKANSTIGTTTVNTDMRGTESAALAADYTSARAGYLDNINGHTAQTGDNYARLGGPVAASISADIANVQADTDDIQTRLPAVLVTGTADSGSTTTMVDAARTEADTDYWVGDLVRFTSGNISGQTRLITAFDFTTDTITFAPATTQAVATQNYEILPWGAVDVRLWNGTAPNNLVAGAVDSDVSNIQTDVVDAGALNADAATEIRDAVTGGAYALDTDANGRMRVVDGTAAGEIDTVSGRVQVTEAQIDQFVDEVWDEVLTGGTHNVVNSAGRRLRQIQEVGGYSGGAIYIDTVNGSAGTTNFENGVETNPVNTIADADTLATSLGIAKFVVLPGSTITLAATQSNQSFEGLSWTLALGGQSIAGSSFTGASVSGTTSGTGTKQLFIGCTMGVVTHMAGTHIIECGIEGTQTAGEAGDCFMDRCHSAIAGTDAWTFDFGASIGNTNLSVRNFSGGIQLENMGDTGTDTASIEGRGQVVEGTCTGGTVAIRGNFTVSGITNLTLSDDARIDTSQINAEISDVMKTDTISEMSQQAPPSTPTFEEALMYLYMAIRNRLDIDTTATDFKEFYNDAGTVIWKKAVTDDGTIYSEAEGVTGP